MIRAARYTVLFALFVTVLLVATPFVLSTSTVKSRIAAQLSDVTGRPVLLNGHSSVSLYPYLGVTYHDVIVGNPHDTIGGPLVTVEKMQAKLAFLAAFWGQTRLSRVTLVKPVFNLRIDGTGQHNWRLMDGPLAERLAVPLDEKLRGFTLGSVRIEDGTIHMVNEREPSIHQITNVKGTIDWPDITSNARARLNGVWRDEPFQIQADVSKPFDLLRDGESAFNGSLKSKRLASSFQGSLNAGTGTANGKFAARSPSLNLLSQWTGTRPQLASLIEDFSLTGTLSASRERMDLDEAQLVIAGHEGKGRLQFERRAQRAPSISGTLAFDEIALLQPFFTKPRNTDDAIDVSMFDDLNMDVRLSASQMQAGPLEIADIAASLLVRDGRASLDLGEATALGGRVSGSVSAKREGTQIALTADVALADIDIAQIASLGLQNTLSVSGTGSGEIRIKTRGTGPADLLPNLSGDGKISGKEGVLSGIDISDFHEKAASGGADVQPDGGSTEYEMFSLGFLISNGTAFLRQTRLETENHAVSLVGRSDLVRNLLALRGDIISRRSGEQRIPAQPFFIGGTLSAPLFTALPSDLAEPEGDREQNVVPIQ